MPVRTVPKRITLSRQAGFRLGEDAINVARPSKWGNPFKIGDTYSRGDWQFDIFCALHPNIKNLGLITPSREDVVEAFGFYIHEAPALWIAAFEELPGHDLACWCKPDQPCHADLLIELTNGGEQ